MTDQDLAARLDRLEALEEIKALKHRYFRAMTDEFWLVQRKRKLASIRGRPKKGWPSCRKWRVCWFQNCLSIESSEAGPG